jgi:hypothetical protein
LSSRWLTLITPVYAAIGRSLIESVRNPSVVLNQAALDAFDIRPMGITRAIERALANEDRNIAETRWSDARTPAARLHAISGPNSHLFVNQQSTRVPVDPLHAFAPIRRIGGRTGWYFGNALWRIRGLIDLMMGGVGMRRGRPDREIPFPGSTLDFWRVESYEPDGASTVITQLAEFEPRGLLGILYWYLLAPIHEIMFRGMLRHIAAAARHPENMLSR